jgi:Bacterial Ig-like domain
VERASLFVIVLLGVLAAFASPAAADGWLPHAADATWEYTWTDSVYNPTPTKEKVTVKDAKGQSFTLAWTTKDEGNPADAPDSAGVVAFQQTAFGIIDSDWSSNPPPQSFPILCATQTDAVWGFTSVKSSSVTVTVYAQPAPPVITSFAVGSVSHSSANVSFSGTGVAGETITLYDGSTNVGTVTVASNGTWTLTVKLASGTHTMTATQTLTAGVTSAASAPVTVVVPSH